MKYLVIDSNDLKLFVAKVEEQLRNGWVCQGGVHIRRDSDIFYPVYYQAMVKQDG